MKTAPTESKIEATLSKKTENSENNLYSNDDSEEEVEVNDNEEEAELEFTASQNKHSIKKSVKGSDLENVEILNASDYVESLDSKVALPAQSQKIKKRQRQSEESSSRVVVEDTKKLYSFSGLVSNSDWDPAKDPTNKEYLLNNFSYDKNNTLAMKLTLPSGTYRWSFNICPPDHCDSTNILLHFNPRYGKKNELIMNDKQGTWGT